SRLTPFAPPSPTTNPVGSAAQTVAVAQAAAGAPARTLITAAPQLISALPQALQGLASPLYSASSLVDLLGSLTPYAGLAAGGTGIVGASVGAVDKRAAVSDMSTLTRLWRRASLSTTVFQRN
ncbi:MAG: hypothetical protein WBZ37_19210, partial [Mycobacterium sp.]